MAPALQLAAALPSTAALLVAGGDQRIALDPQSGASRYGSRPAPDPALVALGSCTASLISPHGWQAADALRATLQAELAGADEASVYAAHASAARAALLALLGCSPGEAEAIFAASGTDLFVLASQWLQPGCSVLIDPAETGSGMPLALRGRHFDARTANGASQQPGAPVGPWQGQLRTVAVREADGEAREPAAIDADYLSAVEAAIAAGQSVLLVLTDVSKTGLIAPSVDCALALRQRWPDQVELLVDACQFRLDAATVRAYLRQGCLVALTGSKFLGGPTFCGALLVPAERAARLRERPLPDPCGAYANAADWPSGWAAARRLPARANLGLLLRWQASLAELRRFQALPPAFVQAGVSAFGEAVRARLAGEACFASVPVPALQRGALLQQQPLWDAGQTIFPFLVAGRGGPLTRAQSAALQRQLREEPSAKGLRYALGQPVACGEWRGVPVAALRLCLGAPSFSGADGPGLAAQAMAALDRVAELAGRF